MFKSCNCQSSIATRVGYALIFCLDALLAWLSLTPLAMHKLEEWSYSWIKMDCHQDRDRCYGLLAVHRITFALVVFHLALGASLINVKDTRSPRAAIQNGWWGPKVLFLLTLIAGMFFIPNGFFAWWGNYVALIMATGFIIIGLVLLIEFVYTWSETCLDNWERTESNFWKYTLIGTTLSMYALTLTVTGVLFAYFASEGCHLNQTLISLNLTLIIILTILSISPAVQASNPRSGLAQASMVAAYCSYLTASSVMNHDDWQCNPITRGRGGSAKTTTAVVGALFTFLAIAYSTSRAATQSGTLVGSSRAERNANDRASSYATAPMGYGPLATSDPEEAVVTEQPRKANMRIQALMAAVEAGAIPQSALDDAHEEDEDAMTIGGGPDEGDDERNGTRYDYVFFHLVFAQAACYTALLLTDWRFVKLGERVDDSDDSLDGAPVALIGRSRTSMWVRVVSSWVCVGLYLWSLVAPLLFPHRFDY